MRRVLPWLCVGVLFVVGTGAVAQTTPSIPAPAEVLYGAFTLAVGGAGYALRHFKAPNGNGIGGKLDVIVQRLEGIAATNAATALNTAALPELTREMRSYMTEGRVAMDRIARMDRKADEQ